MSDFHATPKITRSSTVYLIALACAAVGLNMAFLPIGMAAANATTARPVAAAAVSPMRAASAGGAIVAIAAGTDHSAIAADAVSRGDVETVEMSIAAYDRVPDLTPSR